MTNQPSPLRLLTATLLCIFLCSAVAMGQLQWSSYDTSGNLVTANVATGGSIGSGSVTFTIPANTQLSFVTKNFLPINLATPTAKKTVTFNVSASGGFGGVGQRTMGWGLYNSAGTSGFTDDMGFFGLWNGAGPYLETYDRSTGSANLFSGTHLGQGTANSGTPSDGVTYTNQIQLNMNAAGTGISLGTSSSTLAAAGLGMNGVGVTERAYTNPDTSLAVNNFDEFVFMFNNTTANPVTVTLSQISLVSTVTWDASGTSPLAPTDGAGTWSVTNANWSNGSVDNGWTDGQNAIFGNGGAPGTVTVPVGVTVTAGNITFNTNYTIGGATIMLTNTPTITVNSAVPATNGTALAGTAFTKEGTGTLVLNPGVNDTYTGTTIINNGTVQAGGNDSRIYINGNMVVNPNGTFVTTSGGSAGGIFPITATIILNGGTYIGNANGKYLYVNKIVLANNALVAVPNPAPGNYYFSPYNTDARSGRVFANLYRAITNNVFKSTAGTVVITNRPNSSGTDGHVVTMNAGTLIFDKSSQSANRLLTGGTLTLGGGTLIFSNGSVAVAPSTESPGLTLIKPGASYVQSTNAGASGGSVAFAALTRSVGGTFDFFKNSPGSSTTTSGNVNGILGGWATYSTADWLVGTTLAPYSAYTTSADPTTWVSGNNVSLSGSPSANVPDLTSINSLKLSGAATVTLNGSLTLTSGGLLNTGTGASSFTGGTLLGGSGADLIIHQYSTGDLTISSTLADNGTATSLTKSGPGKLILSPSSNTMTGTNYLNGGTVEVSDLAKLASGSLVMNAGTLRYTGSSTSDSRAITFNGLGGSFEVPSGTTLTLAGTINGSGAAIGDLGGLTKFGAGTLVLTASNYFNGPTVVSNGVLSINGTNAYDVTTWDAGKVQVFGGTLGGNGLIGGPVTVKNGGTISPGNSIGTLTLATNLTLESGSTNLFEITNNAAGDLLAVQGNLTIATNCTIAISILGGAFEPATNVLITYSGTKTGSFNPTVVIVGGSIDSSISIDDSTPGQIKLVAAPQVAITAQPSDALVSTNDPATFNVTATGTAPITYQWYRYTDANGSSPTAQTGATNASFTIPSAQPADSGFYGVVVANNYNSVTSRVATLIVGNVLPQLSGPVNTTVIAGNNATFSTTVVLANPAPTFQWQTNGVNVAGATGSTLTLTSVPYAYDGMTISVIASNAAGNTTNSAILSVIVPPLISPQPTNITVNVADTANFVSGASGVPTPGLQWYKNGVGIPGATGSTLTIANAQGSDIANYSLVATNAAGSITSSVVKLTVLSTSLSTVTLGPTNTATGVCYDTPLYITFNNPISTVNSGKIRIYNSANATTPVDTIDMGSNVVVVSSGINLTNNFQAHSLFPGDSQVINYFPVIVTGNTAAIYPHGGVMTNNQTYYVTIDPGVVRDSTGAYFAGISDTNAWVFSTKATGPANATNIVVAANGSGDFVTVQGAVDSIPSGNNNFTVINIHDGNYNEIIDISGKNNVMFLGQSRSGTVVGYPNNNNLTGTTAGRMAFKVNASDIKIKNLTITNGTPQGGSQAEALLIYNNGLRCVVDHCDIKSRQDTILINATTSQGYFYYTDVYGNFDYIWGSGVGYFDHCSFHTLTNTLSGSYNLTAARTGTGVSSNSVTPWVNPNGTTYSAYGFTFVRCTFLADNGVTGISLAGSNGTAGGLDSWNFCQFSPAYVGPAPSLTNQYVFWQYQLTDTNGNPITFTNVQVIGVSNPDARLLAATNIPTWFSGWTPSVAPAIVTQPTNVTVTAGETATLTVGVTGVPDPTYQWLQNGTNAPYASATSATLTITNAQAADAGTYSVVVSNSGGTVTSVSVTLTVITPTAPTFSSNVQMAGGGNVQFSFSGTSGADYRVWASTDLSLTPIIGTWTLIGSGTFGASPVPFTDTQSTNYPNRFYIITSP